MTPLSNVTDASDSPLASIQPSPASAASSPRSEHQAHSDFRSSSSVSFESQSDLPQQTILASFAPRVACFASEDTDDIAKEKGFPGGFYSLLRPFGEHVQGKVVIRDSVGASKAWDHFGIRFIQYLGRSQRDAPSGGQLHLDQTQNSEVREEQSSVHGTESSLDAILHQTLRSVRDIQHALVIINVADRLKGRDHGSPASGYVCYLRELLSEAVQVPYETFSHPVACIIAVSSRSSAPLEKIRQLYSASGRGNNAIPPWVGVDYLRYYVLVHDENRDDITKSTALFDLMKRHFGLHCFLLRIRSLPCVGLNSETVQSPKCQWMTAAEQLAEMGEAGYPSASSSGRFIFESDSLAIKTFVREMVTQSIVPFMESRIVTWNEQVASKRKGIGGRFMSLSKRWTGFGTNRGANATTGTTQSLNNSNFDTARGYYLPESPEAIMRQLADYTFMLRDFKVAFSTYDALRTDFSNDKAWSYHASANELTSASYLLIPQTLSIKSRSEVVDQKVEAALYSYLTRCSLPLGAARCILLNVELLIGRGAGAAEDATKWAIKSLELGVLSAIPQALMTERVADFHQSQRRSGLKRLGSRERQTAFWNTLACLLWTRLGEPGPASSRLRHAQTAMNSLGYRATALPFPTMSLLYSKLRLGGTELGYEDESSTRPGPVSSSEHAKSLVLDLNERPMYQERSQTFHSADAAGFSAVEANHPDFGTAPSR
ncbi:MAG: hypothetical protein Q9224_001544 [Gallowayella concinna]